MEENPSPLSVYRAKLKASLTDPKILFFVAVALAVGAGGTALGWKYYLLPIRAVAVTRYQSHLGLMRLHALQMDYHAKHGTFANDLDTLLASAPDGPKLRAQLAATMDITTLAVIGDKERFRLEANVLDAQRTSVKIRGKIGGR